MTEVNTSHLSNNLIDGSFFVFYPLAGVVGLLLQVCKQQFGICDEKMAGLPTVISFWMVIFGLGFRAVSCLSIQNEKLNIITLCREMNVDVLTITSKSTLANAIPFFILDLCFTPLHCQEEIAVIGVDAVLHLRP